MNIHFQISPEFQHEISRRDLASVAWLEELPETFEALCRRWKLVPDGDDAWYGKTSIATPVTGTHGPAALKFVSPAGDVEAEERALRLLAGGAIVPLLNASIRERALLLERLDSESRIGQLPPEESVAIAGEIAASLTTVIAPDDIPSLAANAEGWLIGIRQQHERARDDSMHVPDEQLHAAQEAIRALGTDATTTMTHGDLSLDNIMRTSAGSWVAIDPLLVSGPVIHEAHTVVRSLLPQILDSVSPRGTLSDLTKRFCDAAGADYQSAQRLSLARYVASYYWELQNDGDPMNVERLRRASELTFEILR